MSNVVRYNSPDKLETHITKIIDQRRDAISRLITDPSAENASRVREYNGQLWGMLAALNCLEDFVKINNKKTINNCRDLIQKSI